MSHENCIRLSLPRLTVDIEQATRQQCDDCKYRGKPLRVDGSVIGMIQHNTVLYQVANDHATARDGSLPSEDQKPAGAVTEQVAKRRWSTFGLETTISVYRRVDVENSDKGTKSVDAVPPTDIDQPRLENCEIISS